jgi:hypothetical protein
MMKRKGGREGNKKKKRVALHCSQMGEKSILMCF